MGVILEDIVRSPHTNLKLMIQLLNIDVNSVGIFQHYVKTAYWCPKTVKWSTCWYQTCGSWILLQTLSLRPVNLHGCWSCDLGMKMLYWQKYESLSQPSVVKDTFIYFSPSPSPLGIAHASYNNQVTHMISTLYTSMLLHHLQCR